MEGRGILEGACSVLEGRDILEKPLAVFWRSRLQCFGGAGSVLEGCDIFGQRLKCFGGVWHFGGRLQCFGGV